MNPLSPETAPKLRSFLLEGLLLLLGGVMVPLVVINDRHVFMHGLSEHSATELLQAILTALAGAVLWSRSVQLPAYRSWLQALAGLFTLMLIREMDYYLDYIYHGAWSLLATVTLALVLTLMWRSRRSFRPGLLHFLSHSAHVYVMVGVMVVILFSRVFGSGDFLLAIMEERYDPAIKTFMQEGLELLGYFLIAMGSVKYALTPGSTKR